MNGRTQDNRNCPSWVGIHPPTWVGRELEHSLLPAPTTADLKPSLDIIWKHLAKPIYSSFDTPHFSPKLEITEQTFLSPVLGLSLPRQGDGGREEKGQHTQPPTHFSSPCPSPMAASLWAQRCSVHGVAHHSGVWENRRTFMCFKEPFQRKR